jgi:uncharacterized paraquat-inducible protein A
VKRLFVALILAGSLLAVMDVTADSYAPSRFELARRVVRIVAVVMLAVMAFVSFPLRKQWDRKQRAKSGFCPTCRYNLTGNTSGICPECGTAVPN